MVKIMVSNPIKMVDYIFGGFSHIFGFFHPLVLEWRGEKSFRCLELFSEAREGMSLLVDFSGLNVKMVNTSI